MNLSLSNLCWDFENTEAYELLRSNDIKYIELSLLKIFEDWESIDRKKIISLREQLSDYGLKVSSLQSIFFKKKINVFKNSQEFLEHFKSIIEYSTELGCPYIVYGSPRTRVLSEINEEKATDKFIEIFNHLSDVNKDITIGIEPNPEYYNCYFLNTHQKIKSVVDILNCDNVVFHYDLACISLSGDDPHRIYLEELDKLQHVHISSKDLKSIQYDEQVFDFVSKIIQKNSCIYSLEMLNLDKREIINCINKIREWKDNGF
ncbi:MAG: sugar phosphate isomerase/epimerase family protein [Candidatus Hodarchaeales archaeon]|jgi:sugar phosphate isomerase/epimerase